MAKAISVVNDKGIKFNLLAVEKGDSYGQGGSLKHDKQDALIEFYDTRHQHTEYGQYVSSYYASTLLDHDDRFGLGLDLGVPDWYVTGDNMTDVINWIKKEKLSK